MDKFFKKINIKKVLLIISVLVATFFVLKNLGKSIILPFPAHIEFNQPNFFCQESDEAMLVVDNLTSRLIFLNSDYKIENIIDLHNDVDINSVGTCVDDGQYFYVSGVKLAKNSDKAIANKILRYDHNGKNKVVVAESSRKDVYEDVMLYHEISVDDNFFYVTYVDIEKSENEVVVKKYDKNNLDKEAEEIIRYELPYFYMAKYDPYFGKLYVNDFFGRMFVVTKEMKEPVVILQGNIVDNYIIDDKDNIIWLDAVEHNLYFNNELLLEKTEAFYYLCRMRDKVLFDNAFVDTWTVFDLNDKTISYIGGADFSFCFLVYTIVSFISVIYLIVLVLIIFIKSIVNMYKAKYYIKLKRLGIIVILCMGAIFISLFYTIKVIEIEKNNLENTIRLMSHSLAKSIDEKDLEELNFYPSMQQDAEAIEKIIAKHKAFDNEYYYMKERFNSNIRNGYFEILKLEGDKVVMVFESLQLTHFGYVGNLAEYGDALESDEILPYNKFGYDLMYLKLVPIKNELGDNIGIVVYGQSYFFTNKAARALCINMMMTLFTIFIAIYIVLVEIIELFKEFKSYKKMREKEDSSSAEVVFIRTANFFTFTILYIDVMISVFVARDLLNATSINATSFMVALPELLSGIGIALGLIIYNQLSKLITIKKICIISSLIGIFSRISVVLSIINSNFILFCIMKLCGTLGIAITLGTIQMMRVKMDDEENRYVLSRQYAIGRTSGLIFGILLSGFIVQNFGNAMVYVVSVGMAIVQFIFMIIILPKKVIYANEIDKIAKNNIMKVISFVCSPSMIAYFVFMYLPFMLFYGYKGYLFPIYSSVVDMSAMYVTSFYVISRAVLILMSDSIEKLLKNVDYYKIIVYVMLFISVAFLGFRVNAGIEWAIVMLLITGLAEIVILPATTVVWMREANEKNVPVVSVTGTVSILEEIICAFKETVISVLLLFGNNQACILLGILCIVLMLIFVMMTIRKPMAVPIKTVK